MKSTFKINMGTTSVVLKVEVFNGGEINVRLPDNVIHSEEEEFVISARLCDSEGVMALAMIKDALDRLVDTSKVALYMAYTPYARQDRVCNEGEALAIKVFCDIINNMNFHMVVVLDPHSDVVGALLNNVTICPPEVVMDYDDSLQALVKGGVTLVSPDAGAVKKVDMVAKRYGDLDVVYGSKKRDTATGELTGFGYVGDVLDKDLLIVDDICDGGGTFIGLAKELKEGGARSISLYVSHGIFSKGVDVMLDQYFDKIYTTDSFNSGVTHPRLVVIKGD